MNLSFRLVGSACAAAAIALLSGCAAVPADPYYGGYYDGYNYAYPAGAGYVGPGPYYSASPFLVAPAVSVGIVGVYGNRWRGNHGGWRGPGWRGPGWHGGPGWRSGPGWRGSGGGYRGGWGGGHGGGARR